MFNPSNANGNTIETFGYDLPESVIEQQREARADKYENLMHSEKMRKLRNGVSDITFLHNGDVLGRYRRTPRHDSFLHNFMLLQKEHLKFIEPVKPSSFAEKPPLSHIIKPSAQVDKKRTKEKVPAAKDKSFSLRRSSEGIMDDTSEDALIHPNNDDAVSEDTLLFQQRPSTVHSNASRASREDNAISSSILAKKKEPTNAQASPVLQRAQTASVTTRKTLGFAPSTPQKQANQRPATSNSALRSPAKKSEQIVLAALKPVKVADDNPFYTSTFMTEAPTRPPSVAVFKEHLSTIPSPHVPTSASNTFFLTRPSTAYSTGYSLDPDFEELIQRHFSIAPEQLQAPLEEADTQKSSKMSRDSEDLDQLLLDDRNSYSKELLKKALRKKNNRGNNNVAAVKFPIDEIRDSSSRLERIKLGERQIEEAEMLPDMSELFPMVEMKSVRKQKEKPTLTVNTNFASTLTSPVSAVTIRDDVFDQKQSEGLGDKLQSPKHVADKEKKLTDYIQYIDSGTEKFENVLERMAYAPVTEKVANRSPNSTLAAPKRATIKSVTSNQAAVKSKNVPTKKQIKEWKKLLMKGKIPEDWKRDHVKGSIQLAKVWHERFVSTQIKMQNDVLLSLDERSSDREGVQRSQEHLAQIAKNSLKDAHNWQMFRSQKTTVGSPGSPRTKQASVLQNNVWNNAKQDIQQKNQNFYKTIMFYRRLLTYLETISAPTNSVVASFVHAVRKILMQQCILDKNVLFEALLKTRTKGKNIDDIEAEVMMYHKEALNIIGFIRIELHITVKEFFQFLKSNDFKITKEISELRKRWQFEEKQKVEQQPKDKVQSG